MVVCGFEGCSEVLQDLGCVYLQHLVQQEMWEQQQEVEVEVEEKHLEEVVPLLELHSPAKSCLYI